MVEIAGTVRVIRVILDGRLLKITSKGPYRQNSDFNTQLRGV